MTAQCRKLLVKTLFSFWVKTIFFDNYESKVVIYISCFVYFSEKMNIRHEYKLDIVKGKPLNFVLSNRDG